MRKMFSKNDLNNLKKEDLINAYVELQQDYEDLQQEYDDLDFAYGDLENSIEEVKDVELVDNTTMIINLDLFKEKLELYSLKSDKLFDFIDLYMKLYNK